MVINILASNGAKVPKYRGRENVSGSDARGINDLARFREGKPAGEPSLSPVRTAHRPPRIAKGHCEQSIPESRIETIAEV